MTVHPCFFSYVSAVAFLACSCGIPLTPPPKSIPSHSDPISDQVHTSINEYRKTKGRQPLVRHPGLDRLAAQHSRFLLLNSGSFSIHGKKVSHYGFENRVLAARRIHAMDTVGENVAAGRVSKTQAGNGLLKMWQNSNDHHKQLLETWTHTGIGAVTGGDGTVYCTQIFATRNTSLQQSRELFTRN